MNTKFKVGDTVKFQAGGGFGYYEILKIRDDSYWLKCISHPSGRLIFNNWHSMIDTDIYSTKVTKLEKVLC
jgi:hypothetical protein